MSKLVAVIAILCATFTFAGMANAKELFKATLTGAQEVPPVSSDASGKAFLRVDNSETEIEIQLHVSEGQGITQAHIHCAPVGQNGSVVVFLAGLHSAGLDIDGKWISNAVITAGSIVNAACGATIAELVEAMRDGDTYVNVHSIANASGEIRGQIAPTK